MGYGIKNKGSFLRRFFGHRIWSVSLIIFSVILLFLGHGKNDQLKETRTFISYFTSPVLETLSKPFTIANQAAKEVGQLVSLKEEVDRLKDENDKLRHLQTVALQKEVKLKQLQNFLNLKVDPRIKYLTARVIANVNSPYKDTLRLNVGRDNGVAKGQAVIDHNGLLGQIIRVDDRSSTVLLISDINSRIPVRLEPGGVSAMLVGKQDNGVELKYLPYGYELKPHTKILTSGHGAMLPAGIMVGHVSKKNGHDHVLVYSNASHVNYVKILEIKDSQRDAITTAVMKLPPPSDKQKNLRQELASRQMPSEPSKQDTNTDIADASVTRPVQTVVVNDQVFDIIDLEKRKAVKRKSTNRTYNRPRYVGWRYYQTYRDRQFRAQVFSGTVN